MPPNSNSGARPDPGREARGQVRVGPVAQGRVRGGQLGVQQGDSGVAVGELERVPYRLGVAGVSPSRS
ncbi:hypothetical protein SBADM41S_06090 [Streptomyces badius]